MPREHGTARPRATVQIRPFSSQSSTSQRSSCLIASGQRRRQAQFSLKPDSKHPGQVRFATSLAAKLKSSGQKWMGHRACRRQHGPSSCYFRWLARARRSLDLLRNGDLFQPLHDSVQRNGLQVKSAGNGKMIGRQYFHVVRANDKLKGRRPPSNVFNRALNAIRHTCELRR